MAYNLIRVAQATDLLPIKFEAPAAAALSPGHVLIVSAGKLAKHATAGAGGFIFIADLNMLDKVSDAYATDDTVQAYQPQSGEAYNVRMATGQALVANVTPLTSDGAGRLKVAVVGTDAVIAYAGESKTTAANDEFALVKFQ